MDSGMGTPNSVVIMVSIMANMALQTTHSSWWCRMSRALQTSGMSRWCLELFSPGSGSQTRQSEKVRQSAMRRCSLCIHNITLKTEEWNSAKSDWLVDSCHVTCGSFAAFLKMTLSILVRLLCVNKLTCALSGSRSLVEQHCSIQYFGY